MTHFNYIECSNCGHKNPLYLHNCSSCKYYIRETIVNIDLWKTIWGILYSPMNTQKRIVYAEHKNFITFILILLSIKFYSIDLVLKSFFNISTEVSNYSITNAALHILINLIFFIILSYIFTRTTRGKEKLTRFRDNITLLGYSFIPAILTLIFLVPVEYGIFGEYWFFHNPSPTIIKPTIAYLLLFIEGVSLIWSIILVFRSIIFQSASFKKSIFFLFLIIIYGYINIFYIPYSLL